MNSYKLVRLISPFSKVIKRVMFRFYFYLETKIILVNEQKGFRKGMFIDLAICELLKKIIRNMN